MSLDYVRDSKLEITVLRPKKTVVVLAVGSETTWEELWSLEHPMGDVRKLKAERRVPTTFKLAFVTVPGGRRAVLSDLTVESAINAARGDISAAMKDTAGARAVRDGNIIGRSFKEQDNRQNGVDRNRKD